MRSRSVLGRVPGVYSNLFFSVGLAVATRSFHEAQADGQCQESCRCLHRPPSDVGGLFAGFNFSFASASACCAGLCFNYCVSLEGERKTVMFKCLTASFSSLLAPAHMNPHDLEPAGRSQFAEARTAPAPAAVFSNFLVSGEAGREIASDRVLACVYFPVARTDEREDRFAMSRKIFTTLLVSATSACRTSFNMSRIIFKTLLVSASYRL
ncbi:unnamed protein product [Prorocentrum cordatum]|uniref:Transmembrane protein n=1 Tax=Prorocentrum cordatum TaxID=2364126 RepID=A0ABN9S2F9_9DINO|nr:unnamed protein product [Polarella glacialis]